MSNLPRVSVIVPVFNDPRLFQCLDALARQSYPTVRMEVLVIDNGSDRLPEISGYPFARLLQEASPGSYAARNLGITQARGDILAFVDADCTPLVDWLERGVEGLVASGAEAAGGRIIPLFHVPGRPTLVELYDSLISLDQSRCAVNGGFAATANLLAPRETFHRIGPFDASLKSGGDREWGARLGNLGGRFVYLEGAAVGHPARGGLGSLLRKHRRVAGSGAGFGRSRWKRVREFLRLQLKDLLLVGQSRRIISAAQLGAGQRFALLALARFLSLVRMAERCRVALGGSALR